MSEFSLEKYFQRIGYTPSPEEDALTVFMNLHIHHALNIPFENIDVYNKKLLDLTPDGLFEKIVENKRGGYCFEMNTFFAEVLRRMGYQVTPVLARLNGRGNGFGAHSHRANMVTIDGVRWMADVGYGGGGCIAPVNVTSTEVQNRCGQSFKAHWDDEYGYVVAYKNEAGEYCDYISFFPIDTPEQDFVMLSYYTNMNPDSGFRKNLMIMRPTLDGRITLNGNILRTNRGGVKTEEEIPEDRLEAVLEEYFGLKVTLNP